MKAVIEGGVETKPDNILIYAHLTEDILSRKHGMTEMIWKAITVFTDLILLRRSFISEQIWMPDKLL